MKIDIQDVINSGSVKKAILDYCEESDCVASGSCGPTFVCSGPGSGWQQNFDVNDFAARALSDDYGATSYVDSDDGREATKDEDGEIVWSDDSVVKLLVPSEEEAKENPEALLDMAEALLYYHSPASDKSGWRALLQQIGEENDKIAELDLSGLTE